MLTSPFSRYLLRLMIVIGFGLIGAVLVEAGGAPQGSPPQTPQDCAECHVDVTTAWQDSTHAQAFRNPVFQENWQSQGEPGECLACHTTGYDARLEQYDAEGVTCAACHGQTPEDHPPAAVGLDPTLLQTVAEWEATGDKDVVLSAAAGLDPSVAVCANCHTTTFTEWEQSKHGEQQLACVTCHSPHPQKVRFNTEENPNALCLNCHNEEGRDDYAHLTHTDQQCSDCHLHHSTLADYLEHFQSGELHPTGHTGNVETLACVDCHEQISETEVMEEGEEARVELGLTSDHPLLEAQVRNQELEAEIDTVKAQGANTSALRMVQGLLIGVVVGGIVVVGATRFYRRQTRVLDSPENPKTPEE